MRELTFKGFLGQYVYAMSDNKTNDIKLLADEALTNHRLVEPLVLYAVATNKQRRLRRVAKDPHLVRASLELPDDMSWENVLSLLENNDESALRYEYHKAYRSYLYRRNIQKSQNHTKMLILNKTKRFQSESGITNYRVYTDLALNPGNVNAYFRGDVSKVSLGTAERILQYMEHRC